MSGDAPRIRLQSLDIMRGLAALAVLLFHYSVVLPRVVPGARPIPLTFGEGGYGVHLFFIVSGFVILMSLERSTASQFLISRFTRLYPVYWLACLTTFALLSLSHWIDYDVTPGQFLVNLTMLQSFVRVSDVDGVYWSLAYELGFYAFLFTALRLCGPRIVPFLPWYMLVGAVLFRFAAPYIPHPLHLLLMLHQYAELFGCGLSLYLLRTRGFSLAQAAILPAAPLVEALYDGWHGLIVVSLIVAVMSFACLSRWQPGRLARPLIWLGGISYALYLTHQMLGYAVIAHLQDMGIGPWTSFAIALGCALLLAHGLTHYWERPVSAWMKARLTAWAARVRPSDGIRRIRA
jgi:peptidoglycan/LPS O-acetylase OafA/YrhL